MMKKFGRPKKNARWVIVGEWSGYVPHQRKIVHQTTTREPGRYRHLQGIEFTDGTTMKIRLRPCGKAERIVQIDQGYAKLINQAAALNKVYVTVKELA